jgi:hypothetical protein
MEQTMQTKLIVGLYLMAFSQIEAIDFHCGEWGNYKEQQKTYKDHYQSRFPEGQGWPNASLNERSRDSECVFCPNVQRFVFDHVFSQGMKRVMSDLQNGATFVELSTEHYSPPYEPVTHLRAVHLIGDCNIETLKNYFLPVSNRYHSFILACIYGSVPVDVFEDIVDIYSDSIAAYQAVSHYVRPQPLLALELFLQSFSAGNLCAYRGLMHTLKIIYPTLKTEFNRIPFGYEPEKACTQRAAELRSQADNTDLAQNKKAELLQKADELERAAPILGPWLDSIRTNALRFYHVETCVQYAAHLRSKANNDVLAPSEKVDLLKKAAEYCSNASKDGDPVATSELGVTCMQLVAELQKQADANLQKRRYLLSDALHYCILADKAGHLDAIPVYLHIYPITKRM